MSLLRGELPLTLPAPEQPAPSRAGPVLGLEVAGRRLDAGSPHGLQRTCLPPGPAWLHQAAAVKTGQAGSPTKTQPWASGPSPQGHPLRRSL